MAADTKTPPAPPPAPPPAGGGMDDRMTAVENEQKRQGGMLEQILAKLPGQGGQGGQGAPAAPGGKSVAELVREGIEQLEAEKAARADADAAKTARAEHDARLKALEERVPAEEPATAPGRLRGLVQKYGFGIDAPSR